MRAITVLSLLLQCVIERRVRVKIACGDDR